MFDLLGVFVKAGGANRSIFSPERRSTPSSRPPSGPDSATSTTESGTTRPDSALPSRCSSTRLPELDIRDEHRRYCSAGNNSVPAEMVMTLRPRYVVNSRVFICNLLSLDHLFRDTYETLA